MVVILKRRIGADITLHELLQGLWDGCGESTTYIEAKLIHQLTVMRQEVLYAIFLDLHKAYDVLDRYICLGILKGYAVGPRVHHFSHTYWDRLTTVSYIGGNHGSSFKGYQG